MMIELTFTGRQPARPCIYTARRFWSEHGEASLNWLALGLLLAAWNASDNDAATVREPKTASAQPTAVHREPAANSPFQRFARAPSR